MAYLFENLQEVQLKKKERKKCNKDLSWEIIVEPYTKVTGGEPCTKATDVEPFTKVTGQNSPELTKPHSNRWHEPLRLKPAGSLTLH